MESARKHLAPVIQLLQWLQCFSSLGDDWESFINTLLQLQDLTPAQLLHAVKSYRPEVGEKGLNKPASKFLVEYQRDPELIFREQLRIVQAKADSLAPTSAQTVEARPQTPRQDHTPSVSDATGSPNTSAASVASPGSSVASPRPGASSSRIDERSGANTVFLDPALTLPFSLPTSTDMLISYGAGWGGTNRERARKYIPTVPPEVLTRFDRDG
jgi:hypothetical protein